MVETPEERGLSEAVAEPFRAAEMSSPASPHGLPAMDLAEVIEEARRGLADLQRADGHWIFELEADATISAEYILLQHFLGEIDEDELER